MTILVCVHVLVLLAIGVMLRKRATGSLCIFFWPAYLLKLAAGIGVGLLYSLYYTSGDTKNYFHDGLLLANLARNNPGEYLRFLWQSHTNEVVSLALVFQEPRALFLSKVVSICCLFTGSNYWIISCYFSGCCFAAAWHLVEVINRYNTRYRLAAVVAFLFFPSVLFWSSGVVKETLAMASMYFLSAMFLRYWSRMSIPWVLWTVAPLAIGLLWTLKYYYCAAFLPVVFTAVVVQWLWLRLKSLPRLAMPVLWAVVFCVPLALAAAIHPNFYPGRFLDVVVSNYEVYASMADQQNRIYYTGLEASAGSIARQAPLALFSALFRPLPWEAHHVFQYIMAFENCILMVLLAMRLWRWRQMWQSGDDILVFSIVAYIVILGVFLALSTPNFGTLARYRVGFLPFLVLLSAIGNPFLERLQRWPPRSIRF